MEVDLVQACCLDVLQDLAAEPEHQRAGMLVAPVMPEARVPCSLPERELLADGGTADGGAVKRWAAIRPFICNQGSRPAEGGSGFLAA
jgi:hypothetical protein